jgi:hypothetical protein
MRASSFALTLLLVGCADKGDEGFFILNNTAPTGNMCTLTSDTGQPFFARGVADTNLHSGYVLTPLVASRIDFTEGRELERTIHVEGANIVLSSAGADGKLTQISAFTSLVSGSIPPLGTVNLDFVIVPPASTTTPAELSANITLFGTLGGGRIDAEPFNYPVSVCTGCLTNVLGACGDTTVPAAMNKGNPCNLGQDIVVDCCTGTNTLQCPGPL